MNTYYLSKYNFLTGEKEFLDSIPVYVCVFNLTHTNSWMPTECPRIHLNSDTIYLQIESNSTGSWLSLTRPPTTQIPVTSPLFPLLLTNWLYIRGPMTHSLGSVSWLERLTELKKTLLLTRLSIYYKRILKDMNQEPDEEIHLVRS